MKQLLSHIELRGKVFRVLLIVVLMGFLVNNSLKAKDKLLARNFATITSEQSNDFFLFPFTDGLRPLRKAEKC